jgi:hypothetical protein
VNCDKVTLTTQTAGTAIKLSPDHTRITYVDGYDSVMLTPNHPPRLWTFADGTASTLEASGAAVRTWSPDSTRVATGVVSIDPACLLPWER